MLTAPVKPVCDLQAIIGSSKPTGIRSLTEERNQICLCIMITGEVNAQDGFWSNLPSETLKAYLYLSAVTGQI